MVRFSAIVNFLLIFCLITFSGFARTRVPAKDVTVDVTNFDGILSASDDTVLKALRTIDDALTNITTDLCLINGGGEACFTFDSETLSAVVNDTARQTWTTGLVVNNFIFVDGNNFVFVDGNNFTFVN